jgi:DNA polymerase sigma
LQNFTNVNDCNVLTKTGVEERYGTLTSLKSKIVSETNFPSVAKNIGLCDFLPFEITNEDNNRNGSYKENSKLQNRHETEISLLDNIYQDSYIQVIKILNEEAEILVQQISPTKQSHCLHRWIFNRINKAVINGIPGSEIEVLDSLNAKLYLPANDLDFVVFPPEEIIGIERKKYWLFKIVGYLKNDSLINGYSIVSKDQISVIKFKIPELEYGINVYLDSKSAKVYPQVSINYPLEYPGVQSLFLLVKYFLQQRGLINSHTNGLKSSTVLLMVFSFLQNHQKVRLNKTFTLNNLGILFLEFLNFYGSKLNNNNEVFIHTSNGGKYSEPILAARNFENSVVTACDIICSNNNSPQSFSGFTDIKNIFRRAYQALTIKLRSTKLKHRNISKHNQTSESISILNIILTLSDKDTKWINTVNDLFIKMKLNIDDYVSKEDQKKLH